MQRYVCSICVADRLLDVNRAESSLDPRHHREFDPRAHDPEILELAIRDRQVHSVDSKFSQPESTEVDPHDIQCGRPAVAPSMIQTDVHVLRRTHQV